VRRLQTPSSGMVPMNNELAAASPSPLRKGRGPGRGSVLGPFSRACSTRFVERGSFQLNRQALARVVVAASERQARTPTPKATPCYPEGVVHTSPGQRPGFIAANCHCRPTACFNTQRRGVFFSLSPSEGRRWGRGVRSLVFTPFVGSLKYTYLQLPTPIYS